jgi:hypothetical protein
MIVTFEAAPWVKPLLKRLLEIDVVEVLCEARETEQARQFRSRRPANAAGRKENPRIGRAWRT